MKNIRNFFILLLFFSALPIHAFNKNLIPDSLSFQYAGYIGYVSGGPGYSFFHDTLRTELIYGYVPSSIGGVSIHMLTEKNIYSPFAIPLTDEYYLSPINLGFFINYTMGSKYQMFWDNPYPSVVYYRPTSIYTGDSIGFSIRKNHNAFLSNTEYYVEAVTMNTYLQNYLKNDCVTLKEIFSLAFGIRILL